MLPLLYLLISFLPVLIYIGVIWATSEPNSINIKSSFTHFFSGLISVAIIFGIMALMPGYQRLLPISHTWAIFIFSFIQIAFIEEICKFISYIIGENIRGEESIIYDKPISTMFYCGITALGFSFIENVIYALQFGGDVLITRSLFSMLLHFLSGMIMGYWIALSKLPMKIKNKSPLEIFLFTKPELKKVTYYLIGILCAVLLHGFYDFNIFSGGHISSNYLILFSGFIANYLAAKNLQPKSK